MLLQAPKHRFLSYTPLRSQMTNRSLVTYPQKRKCLELCGKLYTEFSTKSCSISLAAWKTQTKHPPWSYVFDPYKASGCSPCCTRRKLYRRHQFKPPVSVIICLVLPNKNKSLASTSESGLRWTWALIRFALHGQKCGGNSHAHASLYLWWYSPDIYHCFVLQNWESKPDCEISTVAILSLSLVQSW